MLPEPPLPSLPAPQPAPPGPVQTPTPAPTPAPPPLAAYDQQGFEGWKQSFLARASAARRDAYAQQMEGLTPDPSVVRLDRNQPEFSRPAGAYVQAAATPVRIAQAKQRIDRVPWPVVQRFGVPSEILVAIWAQESAFGQVQGDYDVIRSLATLAYDGRRREWAEGQLKHALDIVVDGKRERAGLKGSWAGAMGQTQFFQQTWQAQVAHAVALPAGLVGQGAGQPGFTDTGGAADDQVEAVAQPLTTAQLQDQRLIQSARAAVVDVFEAGVVLEPGLAQAAAQALVVAFSQLAVDQQAEAFLEAQAVDVRGF